MSPELKQKLESLYTAAHAAYEDNDNDQMVMKILINSLYGAFGSVANYFFNVAVAEAITTQGKYTITTTEKFVNNVFKTKWKSMTALHDKMGTTHNGKELTRDVSVYIDTDSLYSQWDEVMRSTMWMDHDVWCFKTGKKKHTTYLSTEKYPTEESIKVRYADAFDIVREKPTGKSFVLCLNKEFMEDLFSKFFADMAAGFNAEHVLDFELEAYASKGLWLGKKNYVEIVQWKEPDVHLEGKMVAKGVELVKSGVSAYCKDQIKAIVDMIFDIKEVGYTKDEIMSKISKMKRLFAVVSPETFAPTRRINNLADYTISDIGQIKVKPHATPELKGAVLYNYLIKTLGLQDKYELIKAGTKARSVKIKSQIPIYTVKSFNAAANKKGKIPKGGLQTIGGTMFTDNVAGDSSVELATTLSFPDSIPSEFEPMLKVDYDGCFQKYVLSPIDRLLTAAYQTTFTDDDKMMMDLFMS